MAALISTPEGPPNVSATVKAYCALKLAGIDADSDPLRRARARILALGGLQAANSYVKINLSLFGLYPREHVPSIPPEIVLLPGDLLYEMSSWTRSILVPLSIVQARGSNRRAPAGFTLDELLLPGVSLALPKGKGLSVLFRHLDRVFKLWEKRGPERIRNAAIREAEHWILDRTRHTEGLGAIYPAMMYFIMALDALGYPKDHPDLVEAIRHFESLLIDTERPVYLPALRLAHLGYRHLRLRAGRSRHRRRRPHDARRRLAHQQGGPPQRRLVRQAARHRTLRLGLRIRQRVLSRYRRHRHGAAGAAPRQGLQSHGPGRRRAPRHQLAARHAIGRRRLGGIRRR